MVGKSDGTRNLFEVKAFESFEEDDGEDILRLEGTGRVDHMGLGERDGGWKRLIGTRRWNCRGTGRAMMGDGGL